MDTQQFHKFIAEILEIDSNLVSSESVLEELGWDSLCNLAFISEMDTKLGISVDAQKLDDANSVSDLFALIN